MHYFKYVQIAFAKMTRLIVDLKLNLSYEIHITNKYMKKYFVKS